MNDSIHHRFHAMGKTLALGAAALLVTWSAQAENTTPTHYASVVVQYGDLNLATTAGAQTLYARISTAAERACGGRPDARDLRLRQQYRACYEATVDKAVKKIDSARLQALHSERSAATVG